MDEFVNTDKADIPTISADDLHFNFYHVSGHYYGNESLGEKGKEGIDFNEIRKYMRMPARRNLVKNFLDDKYVYYLEKFLKGEKIPLKCQAMHGSVFVDTYGTIFPCLFYNRAIGKLNEIDYDINKLLKDPDLNQLKTEIENKNCPNCWTPCRGIPHDYRELASEG